MRWVKVIGPWSKNDVMGWYPSIYDLYPCSRISDTTYQLSVNMPPHPNTCVFYIECSEETLAELERSPDYQVMWDMPKNGKGEHGKGPTELPEAAEFGQIRSYLARQKFPQSWIAEHTDQSKTRAENTRMLEAAMRELAPEIP